MRVEADGLEFTGLEAAAPPDQGVECLLEPPPDAAGRREFLDEKRLHRGLAMISTLAKGVPELIGTISLSKPVEDNKSRHSATERQCSAFWNPRPLTSNTN